MYNDKIIEQRTKEKYQRIDNYRSETQLSIQLGQSLNLAVQILGKDSDNEKKLDKWVDYFMGYMDKKRKIVFDENEKMYNADPMPTVEKYEAMTDVQKKFYKDKQLEANRKKYAEIKSTFIKRQRCPDCQNWVAVGEKCSRCHYQGDRYNQ